jgi:prepilin-type N-terminal cleavage/methylation domain-containing protein
MRSAAVSLKGRAGFTILELLVSLTLLAVVLGGIVGVIVSMQRGYIRQRETAASDASLRVAEATLATILRAAGADARNTGQGLLDPNPLTHATFDNVRVRADFNPTPDGDMLDQLEDVQAWTQSDTLYVRWQAGGTPQAVAAPVRSMLFQYFAANGAILPTAAQVVGATRVRIILIAPRHSRTNALARRDSWVYLRNRR